MRLGWPKYTYDHDSSDKAADSGRGAHFLTSQSQLSRRRHSTVCAHLGATDAVVCTNRAAAMCVCATRHMQKHALVGTLHNLTDGRTHRANCTAQLQPARTACSIRSPIAATTTKSLLGVNHTAHATRGWLSGLLGVFLHLSPAVLVGICQPVAEIAWILSHLAPSSPFSENLRRRGSSQGVSSGAFRWASQ